VPYWGDNDEIRSAIVFVLQNVPESVRDFARQQCIFTSMDENRIVSTSFKLPERPLIPPPEIWLIALSEHTLYKSSYRYRKYRQNMWRYIVACELAHAYVNHDGNYPADKDLTDRAKRQVEIEPELAEQWGFRPATGSRFYQFYLDEKKAAEAEKKWNEFTKLFP
jgi:hypothetical protein